MPVVKRAHKIANARDGSETEPIIWLWTLRILVALGAHRRLVTPYGFADDSLAELIGLGEWIDGAAKPFDYAVVRNKLRQLHGDAERQWGQNRLPAALTANLARLSKLVDLSDADCQVLGFAVALQSERMLNDAAAWLGDLTAAKMVHALSVTLKLPETDIRASLDARGLLARSGLVSVYRSGITSMGAKLDLISTNFADLMTTTDVEPIHLLRDVVSASSPSTLNLGDYRHIQLSLDILCPYLKRVKVSGRRGVNIFIHGAPGTGKSELAKVLASELGSELFEVASEDADGDPVNGEQRLRAFRGAQTFFAKRRALIVFDEAEDVFGDTPDFHGGKSTAQRRKAWINRALEDNPVPTLWLSNSIDGLDPAFIRRFDMVFELPVPPRRQRQRIVAKACGDLIDAPCSTRLADLENLAPALVTRAASVVRTVGDQLSTEQKMRALEHLVGNTLVAQGHAGFRMNDALRLPEIYDPAFIRADADLAQIVGGIRLAGGARLCLYGPPGTGKTAYGRWLAEQLDKPLLIKRASDLLSMWLGETEANLARAFNEAVRADAVLLIDEVDSFLQDRRGMQKSWEVTQVNEMLTQMEAFSGIFIASTNLMGNLDQAALRRFDLKVNFDFLSADQALALLERHCEKLGLDKPTQHDENILRRLNNLTPGDFAAVMRQNRFRPLQSATQWVASLHAECAIKRAGAHAPIGFLA